MAVREASTTPLSGQAAKMEQELQVLRQQATDYPRLQMELEIVKQTGVRGERFPPIIGGLGGIKRGNLMTVVHLIEKRCSLRK